MLAVFLCIKMLVLVDLILNVSWQHCTVEGICNQRCFLRCIFKAPWAYGHWICQSCETMNEKKGWFEYDGKIYRLRFCCLWGNPHTVITRGIWSNARFHVYPRRRCTAPMLSTFPSLPFMSPPTEEYWLSHQHFLTRTCPSGHQRVVGKMVVLG